MRLCCRWDNNARAGTLLFQRFLFSLDVPVLPVALRASVPLPLCQVRSVSTGFALQLCDITHHLTFPLLPRPSSARRPGNQRVQGDAVVHVGALVRSGRVFVPRRTPVHRVQNSDALPGVLCAVCQDAI